MSKVRYRINTNYKLKKTYIEMIKKFDVTKVSSNRLKDGSYNIFFTVRNLAEETRVKNFLKDRGIHIYKT